MNVVDSSGWIEFLTDGPGASFFATAIQDHDALLVPSISIFEVYRLVLRERGQRDAEMAVGAMRTGRVVDLNVELAVSAAELAHDLKLAMADSIILATARAYGAVLWTQDADLEGHEGVKYQSKVRAGG